MKVGVSMDYIVKIHEFEGPFDLLLELIKKREMNVYDLQIAQITQDYLANIRNLEKQNITLTSDFMEMAAMLLEIKSKILLPKEEEKEDPREELVRQIIDYQVNKETFEKMKQLKSDNEKMAKRQKIEKIKWNKKKTISDLLNQFAKFAMPKKKDGSRLGELTSTLMSFKYTIEDRMAFLQEAVSEGDLEIIPFFLEMKEKEAWIVTFSALLELIKTQELMLFEREDTLYVAKKVLV